MTDTDKLLTTADSHIAFLNREPQDWWSDEHCMENGQSAVIIDRLAAALRDLREQRDGASEYVRESLERLAQTADIPITDDDSPRANFYLVDDIEAEIRRLRDENARLRARPCPWVETSDGGTSHCTLAAATWDDATTGDQP